MAEERVHRRLAAILAADVVGYSRLMEQEEAGTLARFRSLRTEIIDPRIARDGGRIVKTTGDGILVELGAKPSRETPQARVGRSPQVRESLREGTPGGARLDHPILHQPRGVGHDVVDDLDHLAIILIIRSGYLGWIPPRIQAKRLRWSEAIHRWIGVYCALRLPDVGFF